MNGQFIGTANTNELEELNDEGQAGPEGAGMPNLNEDSNDQELATQA